MHLIRHSAVTIQKDVPSNAWRLSENGRFQAKALAVQFLHPKPDLILTSIESKAIETGQIMAQVWELPCHTFPNLHEHERGNNSFVDSREAWQGMVAAFLSQPSELVLGTETAVQAAMRFETAVKYAHTQFPDQKLAFVTHGRILTAFLSQHNPQIDPVQFWKSLPLPALVEVAENNYSLFSRSVSY